MLFSDLLASRKQIIHTQKVEENDRNFQTASKQLLSKFNAISVTELDDAQFEAYNNELRELKKQYNLSQTPTKTVKNTVVEHTENKQIVKLSENQKQLIQNMVNVAALVDVQDKLNTAFSKTQGYVGVVVENNTLHLKFQHNSYTFVKSINEAEIKSDKEFEDWAVNVLKQAHANDYDEKIAQQTIKDLLKKYGSDYGAAVGALTSGFGQ